MQTNDYQIKIVNEMNDDYLSDMFTNNNIIYVKPGIYAMSSRKIESLIKIAEMQKYYQCNPIRFISDFFNIELIDAQAWIIQRAWSCPNVLVVATRGLGKAVSLDTRIPTPDGDKTIKEIKIGDYIFGADGKPTKVVNTSPIFYNHDCYEMTFSDGEKIVADADHLWSLRKHGKLNVYRTEDIAKEFKKYRVRKDESKNGWEYLYKADICSPLEYKEKSFEIDPYILGLWLGDGSSAAGYITVGNEDLDETIKNIKNTGYIVSSIRNDSSGNKRVNIHDRNDVPLVTLLRKCNLFDNKHIPDSYFYGSIEQRLSLLQGLMDTDGYVSKNGECSFVQSEDHFNIADGVRRLIESLGMKTGTYYKNKICNNKRFPCIEVYFVPDKDVPVFRMQRKYDRLKDKRHVNATHKSIIDIKKIDSVPTKCLMVDNKDHLFLCGEHNTITHNSTCIDLMLMAKGCLFNNYWAYIASGSGSQAEQTFTTLERIANDNIDEMSGSTGYIFKNEVEIKNAAGDGFSHSSNGFSYSLYNGSMTQTLNSNVDRKRGMRGSVIFDESGFLSAEMMKVYGAFAIVNKNFKTGKDRDGNLLDPIRLMTFPTNVPNQKFYISSASSTDTEFYRLYREFSKRQLMGDPDYFVAHIDCEVAFHPTVRGKTIAPLLMKSTVETEMRTNPEKARREYYCEFTSDAGTDAIIRRGTIARNSEVRVPLLYNDTNDKKFVLCYDPARSRDNSVILVAEIYLDDKSGQYKARIVNCVNLLDVGKKRKSPMQTPDQVQYLKELILDYNGDAPDYENIEAIYIDAGSGGAGVNIADYLMEDWVDKKGVKHRGLIDKEYSADYVKKFPNAIDKIRLMSPSQYKSEMYEALIQMMDQDVISFTENYDNKGYITVFEQDGKAFEKEKKAIEAKLKKKKLSEEEFNEQLQEELKNTSCMKTKIIKLDPYQEMALSNIDAMKEEMVNMVRKKRESGKDSFELTPEKANKLHDDRSYCCCMLGYHISEKRRENIKNKKRTPDKNLLDSFKIRTPQKRESIFD